MIDHPGSFSLVAYEAGIISIWLNVCRRGLQNANIMKTFILALLILAGALAAQATNLTPSVLTEDQKIEKLINFIATLDHVTFIRNGSEYSQSKAVEYLKYKLKRDSEKISCARDFILVAGTKSNSSGKPLLIRYNDGRTEKTREAELSYYFSPSSFICFLSIIEGASIITSRPELFFGKAI